MTDREPYEAGDRPGGDESAGGPPAAGPAGGRKRWLARGGVVTGGLASLAVGAILGGVWEGVPVLLAHHGARSALQVETRAGLQLPESIQRAAYTSAASFPAAQGAGSGPAHSRQSPTSPPAGSAAGTGPAGAAAPVPPASSAAPAGSTSGPAPTPAPAPPATSPGSPAVPAAPSAASTPTGQGGSAPSPTAVLQGLLDPTVSTVGQVTDTVTSTMTGAVSQTTAPPSTTTTTTPDSSSTPLTLPGTSVLPALGGGL